MYKVEMTLQKKLTLRHFTEELLKRISWSFLIIPLFMFGMKKVFNFVYFLFRPARARKRDGLRIIVLCVKSHF